MTWIMREEFLSKMSDSSTRRHWEGGTSTSTRRKVLSLWRTLKG